MPHTTPHEPDEHAAAQRAAPTLAAPTSAGLPPAPANSPGLEAHPQQPVMEEQPVRLTRANQQQLTPADRPNRSCSHRAHFPSPALPDLERLYCAHQPQNAATAKPDPAVAHLASRHCVPTQIATKPPTEPPIQRSLTPLVSTSDRAQTMASHQSPCINPHNSPSTSGVPCQPQQVLSTMHKMCSTHKQEQQLVISPAGASSPNSSKRRRIASSRLTYSPHQIRQLRHTRKSLDPRELGLSAIIFLTEQPVPTCTMGVDPKLSFSDMHLPCSVLHALNSLDFHRPSPIQQAAIPRGRLGGDIIAHSKSGTGKTLAFIIIALEALLASNVNTSRVTSVLILVPTRELTDQVANVFRSLSRFMNPQPRALVVKGGLPVAMDEKQLSLSAPHVVIGTPGRVLMLIEKGVFVIDHINLLVLDEADRLAESAFTPSVPTICKLLPSRRQTLAFSATFEPWLRDMLLNVMRSPAFFSFPTSTHASDDVDMLRRAILDKVCQYKVPVFGGLDCKLDRVASLLSNTSFRLCIVFINDKRYVAKILLRLKSEGFKTGIMNASLGQKKRDRTIHDIQGGKLQVIVASDLLARGLDFEECDLILHLDVPYNPATYLHRVGRAGRFGRNGTSFLFFNLKGDELHQLSALETSLGSHIAMIDNLIIDNRGMVHHSHESSKNRPTIFASVTNVVPSSKGLPSDGPQIIRESGHGKVYEDEEIGARRLSGQNVDYPVTSHPYANASSSALPVKQNRGAPENLQGDGDAVSHIAPNSKSRDPRLRAKDSPVILEKKMNHLQRNPGKNMKASQLKQKNTKDGNSRTAARTTGDEKYGSCAGGLHKSMSSQVSKSSDINDQQTEEKVLIHDGYNPNARNVYFSNIASCGFPKIAMKIQRVAVREKCEQIPQTMGDEVIPTHGSPSPKGPSTLCVARAPTGHKIDKGKAGLREGVQAGRNEGDQQVSRVEEERCYGTAAVQEPTQGNERRIEDHQASPVVARTNSGITAPRQQVHGNLRDAEDHRGAHIGTAGSSHGHNVISREEKERYDMWDAYARDAYAAGYREAYEEAYQMAREIQDRLHMAHI